MSEISCLPTTAHEEVMTPTQQVTLNAQEFLGPKQNVLLAIRVEWGTDITNLSDARRLSHVSMLGSPAIFPLVAVARLRSTWHALRTGSEAAYGILAMTSASGCILMSAARWQRKKPTGVVDALSADADLEIDVELMETNLIPLLRIDGHELVVNGIDFKALLKAVESGTMTSRYLTENLERLQAAGGTPWG